PTVILTYTIKPNIYGGIIAKKYKIPYIANVTGLGSALINKNKLQKLLIYLYKIAFSNVSAVFFQNKENKQFFADHNIAVNKHKMLPGSGVNLNHFHQLEYPNEETVEFVFISRIMKEKGIDEYLIAAKYIKEKYPNTVFHVCGNYEENYEDIIYD